jgi:hypothetical protein
MTRNHLRIALLVVSVGIWGTAAGVRVWTQNQEALAVVTEMDAVAAQIEANTAQLKSLLVDIRTLLSVIPAKMIATAAELTNAVKTPGNYTLAVGPEFKGNFVITASGVTLSCAQAPPERRVTPADVAGCHLVALDRAREALRVLGSEVTVRGLTLSGALPTHDTANIGSNDAVTAAEQPSNVWFDQMAILADPAGGHRGLGIHAAHVKVTRSHLAGYVEQGRDSQAVWMNNTPGPVLIEDNFIEASGENLLVGGATVKIPGLVAADITIRRNTFYKNPLWRRTFNPDGTVNNPGRPGSVKNTFELKCAKRVTFEDNVLENMWVDGQAGNVIVLTPRNQNGDSPWCLVEDVKIVNNVVINQIGGAAVNILGISDSPDPKFSTGRTARILIDKNLFRHAHTGFILNRGIQDLTISNNTLPDARTAFLKLTGFVDPVKATMSVLNNVVRGTSYGISGDGTTIGKPSLDAYAPNAVWVGNVTEKITERGIAWPTPCTTPTTGCGTLILAPGALPANLDAAFHYIPGGAGW